MAITTDDFNKIWASTSPLTPYSFSASQYKEGWNFIGSTPPSRQMWDYLQKNNDEKMKYLLNNFDNYLPLSGGTLTGDVDITGDLSVSGAIYSSDPASGENSGQVPTTAWVQNLVAQEVSARITSAINDLIASGDVAVAPNTSATVDSNTGITSTSWWNKTVTAPYNGWYLLRLGGPMSSVPTPSAYLIASDINNYIARSNGNGGRDFGVGPIWIKKGKKIQYSVVGMENVYLDVLYRA